MGFKLVVVTNLLYFTMYTLLEGASSHNVVNSARLLQLYVVFFPFLVKLAYQQHRTVS